MLTSKQELRLVYEVATCPGQCAILIEKSTNTVSPTTFVTLYFSPNIPERRKY